jgi:hypothetical protein
MTIYNNIFDLSHPLILDVGYLTVGVPHHGNQQVNQQHRHYPTGRKDVGIDDNYKFYISIFKGIVSRDGVSTEAFGV